MFCRSALVSFSALQVMQHAFHLSSRGKTEVKMVSIFVMLACVCVFSLPVWAETFLVKAMFGQAAKEFVVFKYVGMTFRAPLTTTPYHSVTDIVCLNDLLYPFCRRAFSTFAAIAYICGEALNALRQNLHNSHFDILSNFFTSIQAV